MPAATVAELLRCADVAMYAAKAGREGVHVYVPDPESGTGDRLRTMEELRTALDERPARGPPAAAGRPGRGGLVGAEALVRWRHPTRGLLSPAELLPAAEQAGLLRPLTDQVLELALAAAARWWPRRSVPVSVNLSAANVTDLDLPGKVALALARHGLPARALTLELVEDTLMADPERGRTVLGELRRLGIRTSIDDYGTGYSSLAYLRHLPADELKLDRSLTADVGVDRAGRGDRPAHRGPGPRAGPEPGGRGRGGRIDRRGARRPRLRRRPGLRHRPAHAGVGLPLLARHAAPLAAGRRPSLSPAPARGTGSSGSPYKPRSSPASAARRDRTSGGSTSSRRLPKPASSLTSMPIDGPATTTSTRPSRSSVPTESRAPSRTRRTGRTPGSARPRTRT